MEEKEIWKQYNDRYYVSNKGRVYDVISEKMKPIFYTKIGGYAYVNFNIGNRKTKHKYVHRLVAELFVPNPCQYKEVNHIDEDKKNNFYNNLEWCSHIYNNNYGTKNIRCSITKTKRVVLQFSLDGKFVCKHFGTRAAAESINGNRGGISKCCLGKTQTAYGYIWKYES